MALKWLRLYTEILDDPKLFKLSDKDFRIFIDLMCVAQESDKGGIIDMSIPDIAWRVRLKEKDIQSTVDKLLSPNMAILTNENGQLRFVAWEKRQFQSDNVGERVKRYRKKSETLQETGEDEKCNGPEQTRPDQTQNRPDSDNQNVFVLPEWIPPEVWSEFQKVRKKKKAACTDYAHRLIVKELERIRDELGQDPVAVLNKSIKSGWSDVYELKTGGNWNGTNNHGNNGGNGQPAVGTKYAHLSKSAPDDDSETGIE
jgi:hypothetical protein